MAAPCISVVMPMHNVNPTHMLNSLARIKIPMQIIAVDDASEDDTVAIVQGWSSTNSIPIHILRNDYRLYSYRSRLKGLRYVTAPIIWNVDADDQLPHDNDLLKAITKMEDEKPDIMHCRLHGYRETSYLYETVPWTEPVAAFLQGRDVYNVCMSLPYPPPSLCNKFLSARLCQQIVENAPDIEVRYLDVKFLSILAFVLCDRYLGSNDLVYEYKLREKHSASLYSKQVKALILLRDYLGPVIDKLAPWGLDKFYDYCDRRLAIIAGRLSIAAQNELQQLEGSRKNEWLRTQVLPNLAEEELLYALRHSLSFNTKRILELIQFLGGRGCVEGQDSKKNTDKRSVYDMFQRNAWLANRLICVAYRR